MVNQKNDEGCAEGCDASLKSSGTSWFEPRPLIVLHKIQCQSDFRHFILWVRIGIMLGFCLLD